MCDSSSTRQLVNSTFRQRYNLSTRQLVNNHNASTTTAYEFSCFCFCFKFLIQLGCLWMYGCWRVLVVDELSHNRLNIYEKQSISNLVFALYLAFMRFSRDLSWFFVRSSRSADLWFSDVHDGKMTSMTQLFLNRLSGRRYIQELESETTDSEKCISRPDLYTVSVYIF